jgi:hypothetical protein
MPYAEVEEFLGRLKDLPPIGGQIAYTRER